jgi:hypothetical protein
LLFAHLIREIDGTEIRDINRFHWTRTVLPVLGS